jgi:hypothetical protein
VAHGERQRHNAVDQERVMCSGPKSKATGPSWVYDGQPEVTANADSDDVVPKSASRSLPPLSCLRVRDCRSRHGRVSACSRSNARLSEPMRGQGETEFAQVPQR